MPSFNQNASYGRAMFDKMTPKTFGRTFVVFNSSDNNQDEVEQIFAPFNGQVRYFESLDTAIAQLDTNRYDTIILNSQNQHTITATSIATLAGLSRFKLEGLEYFMGAKKRTGQRSRLALADNTAVIAATLMIGGVGVHVHGIKVQNSGTDAASVAAAIFYGEACHIEGNSFMKFSDLDQTAVADVILSGDSDTFNLNEFGFDTLVQSAARPTVRVDGYSGMQLTRLEMSDCNFVCQSSTANKVHFLVNDTAALRYSNKVRNCEFDAAINATNSAVTLTNAVASASGLVEGNIHFVDCPTTCTNFCAGVTDNIKVSKSASSNNANESTTPA